MNYGQYMSKKLARLPVDKSRNFEDVNFDNNDPPNQGAIDLVTKFSGRAEQEGQRQRDVLTTT